MSRDPRILSFGVSHPTWSEWQSGSTSHIFAAITYEGLRSNTIDAVVLTEEEALRLAEQLLKAVNQTRRGPGISAVKS